MRDKLVPYGERPITEFCFLLMTKNDLIDLVNMIELTNDKKIEFDDKQEFEKVFIEAPLGQKCVVDILLIHPEFFLMGEVKPESYDSIKKRLDEQISRYLGFIKKQKNKSKMKLVQYIFKIKSEKKNIYFISVTKDDIFPEPLKEYYKKVDSNGFGKLGWLSYSFFEKILQREQFKIEGERQHIWVQNNYLILNYP